MRAAVPTGTVDLFTTTAPGASTERISSTTASTARQVGHAAHAHRGGHAQEHDLGGAVALGELGQRRRGTDHERQPARRDTGLDQLGQPVLADPDLAPPQPLHLPGVEVGAAHPVAQRRQAGTRRETDVARSDHRDPTCEHQSPSRSSGTIAFHGRMP